MPHDKVESQRHYAIIKLEEAARSISHVLSEMPVLRQRLEKHKDNNSKAGEIYGELQKHQIKLRDAITVSTLSLLETDMAELAAYSIKLNQSIKSFNLLTPDYNKLCAVLNSYLSKLPLNEPLNEPSENATTNAGIIGRLMNNVKLGYYPTDLEHVKYLAQGIEFPPDVTVNALDPCCGCGLALNTLAQGNNCNTYGIELDTYRAEEALSRLNRVGFGSFYHARISREAFHIMLLNPPYLSVMTEGGNNTRSEKRFLVDSIGHLMYGGLLIYIVPNYRLTADICRVLCDNFSDMTVWRFENKEFKKFSQIAIMGIRQKRGNGSAEVQSLQSLAIEPHKLPVLSELPLNRYQLPSVTKKVELFKGADFNVAELAEQLKKSKSFSKLFERSKLDNSIKRPLLPLNIGQVGLIGGSGLINGLVDCDTPHIIKGRIIKQKIVSEEENINQRGETMLTTVYETKTNKMVFNILTPNGFKSLS